MAKYIRNEQKRTPEERLRATLLSKPTRYQMTASGAPVTGPPKTPVPHSYGRRLPNSNQTRETTLFPEDIVLADHILITGGIGDFIVLESHMDDNRKAAIHQVTLATRASESIQKLLDTCPVFPNLKSVSTIQIDWSKTFCFTRKEDIEATDLPESDMIGVQDWSIMIRFPFISHGVLGYHKSSLVTNTIADISRFELPERYVSCNPYSPNDRRHGRDFSPTNWDYAIDHAERLGAPLVVVNISDDFIPDSPSVINLNRKTSLAESIEVIKGSCSYIGIDSCLSVIASQVLGPSDIKIKSNNAHLHQYKNMYYAPHKHINFITEAF